MRLINGIRMYLSIKFISFGIGLVPYEGMRMILYAHMLIAANDMNEAIDG